MKIPSQLGFLNYCLKSELEGSSVFLVGGCVRDFALGKAPKDFDIVTDVPIDIVDEVLSRSGFVIDRVGKHFLVLIASKNGQTFEISNFRKDFGSLDGRHPEKVEVGTIEEDAHRRDFTVNSLYYDIKSKEIISPVKNALSDCFSRTLRFIGKPEERIKEDYLRVFRFYRFLKEKQLSPDSKSLAACRKHFEEAINKTSSERIRCEIERML